MTHVILKTEPSCLALHQTITAESDASQLERSHKIQVPDTLPTIGRFTRFDLRRVAQPAGAASAAIERRVNALAPEEGLLLMAPFLPWLLIEKLADEGFQSHVEQGFAGDWFVWFWRGLQAFPEPS
jgi:hypothetical protein